MEDKDQIIKEKNYIKILALLQIQINEIEDLNKKPIENIDKPLKYYLVNKDIIDNYKYLELFSEVSKCVEKLKSTNATIFNFDYFNKSDNVIDVIIKNNNIKKHKLEIDETVLPLFFETEKLKINGFEYPYNFFILRKEILDLFFKIGIIKNINSPEFTFNTEYNLLIGKEGVFIWNPIKQKEYLIVYFLNKWDSEINKIYLYKEEKDFINELKKNIKGKTICEYFQFRNIKNKEIGFYNLIYDGKIFGRYINIMRNINYEEEETTVDLAQKFGNMIKNYEKNDIKIEKFLIYLLICLYSIEDLRDFCKNNLNDNTNIINEKKEKLLIDAFSEFVIGMEKNSGKNIEKEVKSFLDLFYEKNLGENIEFNKGHINRVYENLIVKVIDTFVSEIKKKQNLKNNLNDDQKNNKIFQLFYGLKNESSVYFTYFNTLYINPRKFEEKKDLNEIINSLEFNESGIINLPEVLILIYDKENNNNNNNNNDNDKDNNDGNYYSINDSNNSNNINSYNFNNSINSINSINSNHSSTINIPKKININIPLEIMIDKGESFKKRYIFLSCIQYNYSQPDNFYTIVKKKEKYVQIQLDINKNMYEEKIIEQKKLSESFIFFYEKMKEDQYSSGNNSIYNKKN